MKYAKKYTYIILSLWMSVMLFSCDYGNNNQENYAYLGGEIINPRNNWIILYDTKAEVLDTLILDASNRFMHKITNLTSGLYSIVHGGEYQMMLLEPSDSIMFRLNTYDFDESLVFTGRGSRKNNYLIKTYLENEKEANKLVKYAQMEPEVFDDFVEKRRAQQHAEFNDFIAKTETSAFFKSIIRASIDYNTFADKEIYPFAYFGYNKLIHVKDLPEDFYKYRDSINYNALELDNFFSYNRFLFSHFDNLALKAYYDIHPYHSAFNRHSSEYNIAKLMLIDSLVTDNTIKNRLLKFKTRDFLNNNQEDANDLLSYYLKKSTNEEDKTEMKSLVAYLKQLIRGNKLPNVLVYDLQQNTTTNLKSVINKPSIIYFWSTVSKSKYRNSHFKVKELKAKFPNMEFISINIGHDDDTSWKTIIKNYNFSLAHEYKFKNSKQARKIFAINYLDKAIIVDENAFIIHPNTNIYSSNFEKQLLESIQNKHLVLK